MDIDPAYLVRVRQVHGNDVRVATIGDTERGTHPDATDAPVADALITGEPGVALMTLHADCLAMFLVDPTQRAVAAVHAGWRSTVADITGRTVHAMRETFAARPEDLIAYVGPSIGAERYEVGDEVIDAWRAIGDLSAQVCHQIEGRWRFDLKAANRAQLVANGLKPEHIEVSGVCTASDSDRWFSHRAQGPLTGRSAAIIAIAGGNQ
jgi:YfiH family protein